MTSRRLGIIEYDTLEGGRQRSLVISFREAADPAAKKGPGFAEGQKCTQIFMNTVSHGASESIIVPFSYDEVDELLRDETMDYVDFQRKNWGPLRQKLT